MSAIMTTLSRTVGQNRVRTVSQFTSLLFGVLLLTSLVNIRGGFLGFDRGVAFVGGLSRIPDTSKFSGIGPSSYVMLAESYALLVLLSAIFVVLCIFRLRKQNLTESVVTAGSSIIALALIAHRLFKIIGLHDPRLNESYFSAYNELIRESVPFNQSALILVCFLILLQWMDLVSLLIANRGRSGVVNESQ